MAPVSSWGALCVRVGLALGLLGLVTTACSFSSLDDLKTGVDSDDAGPKGDGGKCAKKTCSALGAECGQVQDGCGGILDCGKCDGGKFCGGAGPNKCGTTPC